MSRYVLKLPNLDGRGPSDDLVKDVKVVIRAEAEERKAKIGRMSLAGNSLEFTVTPDEAGEEITAAMLADSGLEAVKVHSRFASLATKHNLVAKATGK